ncbi:GDSL-type esterase/lipase family protein [Archangium lansingense]|uniref:GDSL-type esterase/lipase family protein n=1 Tax=Archangium lansingense TaxID=2995310 RepID=A0ABT4AP89_9BACT|nr:GDSL-type esterase/lipase family protein [Archangium lansinium]MCY1082969.1 GDSL-type esterase/lipase family protein [Archangium lansinium]
MIEASRGRRWAVVLLVPFLLGALLWVSWSAPVEPQAPRRARAPRTSRPAASPDKPLRLAQAAPAAQATPPSSDAALTVSRVLPPPSPRALKLYQIGKKLGVREPRLENPCVAPSGTTCSRTALSPFFESLDALSSRGASSPAVISAFGNSLIAGDRIVDIIREELGANFGDGGRGVLTMDRLGPYGPRVRTGFARGGWEPRTLGELKLAELPFGITGIYHRSTTARASSRFALENEPHGTLWWLDVPRAGQLSVHADGKELARAEPQGSGQAQALAFDIPEGTRHLEVIAEGRGAVVLGLVLQHQRPGIVLDTLGVPSADANLFLRAREDIFRTQLAERSPRLLLFILGGNEAKRLEWGRSNLAEVEEGLRSLVRRSRAAAPGSACLVVGPIDAVRGGNGANKLAQRPYLDEVISIERQIALSEGCAFFDIFSAMGGSGSLARFVQAGLVHEDLVHPRSHGLDILGQLITDALLRSWVDAGDPRRQAALAPPLQASEETQ